MLLSSLAVIALSAASAVSPFSRVFHLHPSLKTDKITIAIENQAHTFQDVSINGHGYTIFANQCLYVSGPAGTTVVADSTHGATRRGDTLVVLQPQLNSTTVVLK